MTPTLHRPGHARRRARRLLRLCRGAALVLVTAAALMGGGVAALRADGAPVAANQPQPVLPLEPLEIATRKGVVVFEVEVVRTPEQLATGLMFRRELPERRGMLFDFKDDQPIYMWMKNTFIPLDMLFIRSDGTIARIAANTTPFSTQTIPSGEPARAVLEIAGGSAQRLGIAAGDQVAYPIFRKR